MNFRVILLFSFIPVFFSGCGRSSLENGTVSVFETADSSVLASVNGEPVTAKDYRDRYALEEAVFTYTNAHRPARQIPAARERFMQQRAGRLIAELVNQLLIRRYLAAEGIARDDKREQAFLKAALKRFKFRGSVSEFAGTLGVDKEYLVDQILAPERVERARERFGKGPFTVSEKEIDEGRARQDKYYARAVLSNTVAFAACSNILSKVLKEKMDFAEAGRKYGEHETGEAVYWSRMEASEFENAAMKAWAFSAPIGSVGGPFELDDGVSVVKILDRTSGTLAESLASREVAEVTLARITRRLLVTEPEPRTREYVRKTLLKWKAENAQKSLLKKLHAEMSLSYPNGTNFVYKKEGFLK